MLRTLCLILVVALYGCASGKLSALDEPPAADGAFAAPRADGSVPRVDGPVTQPSPDMTLPPTPDTALPPDASPPPTAPDVVVSEIMADPLTVTDNKGEWFELHNRGQQQVDLKGWSISDDGTNTHTIKASLVIPPGGYRVLGINADFATNGGVKVDYAYGYGWYLSNGNDEIVLRDTSGALVERLSYDTTQGWVIPVGATISLKQPALNPNASTSWCQEPGPWSGSSGDRGSPGLGSHCTP